MTARPSCRVGYANITAKAVVAAPVLAKRVVALNTSDSQVTYAAAGAAGYGVSMSDGIVGAVIDVAVLGCGATARVKVGTGGATRGSWAVVVGAEGRVTNAVALGGGNVAKNIVGKFEESGVDGDEVGLILQDFTGVSA